MKEAAFESNPYPEAIASYDEVIANSDLFLFTLENLHAAMRTKFMIPVIGGKELDLHRLFVEVCSRGGFEKVIKERRWKEITNIFNFPNTATNASFILRKYYLSLLHHYEQLYFSNPQGSATPTDSFHSPFASPFPTQEANRSEEILSAEASSAGSPVVGVIDGKFDDGYLVTVTIGSKRLRGVLYQQATPDAADRMPQQSSGFRDGTRRRRKKCEIKRRDPSHPKPNRSGYNFFFSEQHARLKPLHPGKDREISRMIGELWNNLNESDRSVYQEEAVKDKERYRREMEDYREKQRGGLVVSDALPLQELHPEPEADMVVVDGGGKVEEDEDGDSPRTIDNESSLGSGYEDANGMEKEDREITELFP